MRRLPWLPVKDASALLGVDPSTTALYTASFFLVLAAYFVGRGR